MRPGRQTLLTPEVHEQIVAYIRAGAFDWVAAAACGIPAKTYHEWISRGEGRDKDRKPNALYAGFAADVRTARAQARVVREIQVAKEKPDVWLRMGPGRTKPGEPGWTDERGEALDRLLGLPPAVQLSQTNQTVIVESADMGELLERIREAIPHRDLIAHVNQLAAFEPGPEDFDDEADETD